MTGAYSASKHAVRAMADALRREVAMYGIGVVIMSALHLCIIVICAYSWALLQNDVPVLVGKTQIYLTSEDHI